jgi:hypothetical protein
MTAYRIVTDHEELENVGQLTHAQLDDYVQNTGWVIASGSTGPFPPSARRLVQGPGVTISDFGPGGDLVISANGATTGSQVAWMEAPVGANDGINQDFTLAHVPLPSGSLMFFYNGVLQFQGPDSDYVIVSGTTVHLLFPPRSGSSFWTTYPF